MRTADAVLAAESRLSGIISVLPMSDRRWLVQCILPNELVLVDEQLTPIWRVRLPPGRLGRAAVAEDLSLVALPQAGHLLLLDATGRQLTSFSNAPSHGPSTSFSCGAFTADGARLWVIVPTGGAASAATAGQELWLIDVATRSVLDRRRLAVTGDDGQLVRHPDGRTIGLLLWIEGGAAIGWARADHDRIDLRVAARQDRMLAAVHPAGMEYLTVSLDRDVDLLRQRISDDRPIGALKAPTIHWSQDWGHQTGYLSGDLIAANSSATDQHFLIGTAPMRLLAEITYPRPREGAGLFMSGQGTWLTVTGPVIRRWLLPPSPGEQLQLPAT
jgi:hypothetical protein